MNSARSDFLHVARERGYIHQTTEEGAFLARLQAGPLAGYIGFDATADSLHVGSLVQIMLLRLMQQTGNRPVVLMGGGTTKVGDPSFRDEARPLLAFQRQSHADDGKREAAAGTRSAADLP